VVRPEVGFGFDENGVTEGGSVGGEMAENLFKNAFFAETIKRWQKNCICAEPGFPS
jgi:hypothetical protein